MALCRKPFKKGILEFGCGQCLPCRIKRRREWTHRILLESLKHGDSCFVTLTYKFEQYGGLDAQSSTLDPEHVQRWIKRLRRARTNGLRYYLVGEYGDHTQRPHYHVALFGYPACFYGRTRHGPHRQKCCGPCDLIRETWGLGHVDVGNLTAASAQYVAGYVTKKLNGRDDRSREILKGRYPEFSRQSRRPGIGATAMEDLCLLLASDIGARELINAGDVPLLLKHGRKGLPLARFLRTKLRKYYGFPERRTKATSTHTTNTPEGWEARLSEEMLKLYEAHSYDYKKIVAEKMQKLLNVESRQKKFMRRKLL